jgi:predicted Zn finger-like uncharacterized protein
VKFLCEQCKAKYQIADEKAAGKTVRMKCRKCGHLIEVRAGVVEGAAAPGGGSTSLGGSSAPPAASGAPAPPRAGQKPAPPRAAPLASAKPSGRQPEKPAGALAGALKSALQRDDEISAPVDMSDLSPSDEWYVAINGVPVGPIRIAEVRRKAAIGAVTEESLCWQEGLDEWRALRSFPELAAIVREAFTSGRSSMTPPPPEARTSLQPPQPRTSIRPASPSTTGAPPRAPTARPAAVATPPPPAARSNVVPITSRLATAERLPREELELLAEEPDDLTRPFMGTLPSSGPVSVEPAVVPDPFAPPPRAATAPAVAVRQADPFAPGRSASLSVAPSPVAAQKKSPPWMAIAMIAAAAAFGVTAAIAVFLRPATPPAPVVVQVPGAPATAAATAAATSPAATTAETSEPVAPTAAPTSPRGGAVAAVPKPTAASTAAAPARGPLDLHSLAQGSNVAPSDDPGGGGDAPRAPGQCISGGQVQQVIGLHRVALQRACWERSASQKPSANVTVSLTIGADGSAQGVSASGDDTSVAKCIENDVRGWHFPAMGCSQPTSIPFHFVRQ